MISFLSVTNNRFVPIVSGLLKSTQLYHPEIPMHLVCVNVIDEKVEYLKTLHGNLTIIREDVPDLKRLIDRTGNLENTEPAYCVCSRTWHMLDLMKKGDSVFYLDADVTFLEPITELLEILPDVDLMVRAKKMKPFMCNAGMIWAKNTKKNVEIIEEWAKRTNEKGIRWFSDQKSLNEIITKYMAVIKYETFPEKFNGISTNEKSVIVHMKGPKGL